MSDLMTATAMTSEPTVRSTRSPRTEATFMLLHEALARSRMREAEQAAREHALVRALTVGRRWRMLARYAERRATAAEQSVPNLPRRAPRDD